MCTSSQGVVFRASRVTGKVIPLKTRSQAWEAALDSRSLYKVHYDLGSMSWNGIRNVISQVPDKRSGEREAATSAEIERLLQAPGREAASSAERERLLQAPRGGRLLQAPGGERLLQAPSGERLLQAPGGERLLQAPRLKGRCMRRWGRGCFKRRGKRGCYKRRD